MERLKNKIKVKRSGQAIRYVAVSLIVATFVFCAFFTSRAWVEPGTAPPGGNIEAPVHTGTAGQWKKGPLSVNWSGAGTYGLYAQGSDYAVYGYEIGTGAFGLLGYENYGGYFAGYTAGGYFQDLDNGNRAWIAHSGYGGWFDGPVYSNTYFNAPQYCLNGSCISSWPTSSETLQTVTDRGWWTSQPLYTSNYIQAPIFYDQANSGYYVDPNATSNVNAQYSNTLSTGYLDLRYAGGDSGQGDNAYAIFQEGGSWSYPYPDLRIAYHTGIKLGANASYNGIRFYNDYNMKSMVMSVNDAETGGANNVYIPKIAYITDLRNQYMYDWNDSAYYIDMNGSSRVNALGRNYGWNWTEYDWNNSNYYMDLNNTSRLNYGVFDNVYSYGWMQAPILYDSQNNGYYLDPNGTSRLNYTVNDNVYSYGWMQAPIFYDANNNGYYVDPSSASVFNVVYAYQFNCLSDIQLKKDIQPIGNALDKILTLRGVKFNWKDPAMGAGNQVGLIAQDVEKVLPEVVSKNGDGYLSVDYSKLSPLLIEAVKDLKTEKDQEINNLQQKIDILEADKKTKDETLNDLLKRIEALESK